MSISLLRLLALIRCLANALKRICNQSLMCSSCFLLRIRLLTPQNGLCLLTITLLWVSILTKFAFYALFQVKEIEKRDSVLTPKQQIDRLLRPGSTYFNLNPFEVLQIDPDLSVEEAKKKYRRVSSSKFWSRFSIPIMYELNMY